MMGLKETSGASRTVQDLFEAWNDGCVEARDQIFDKLYQELMKLSGSILNSERPVSLSTGDLVHEAAVRLVQLDRMSWHDRSHFMAMSARMMRRVLIDRARAKRADKRHHHAVTLVTEFHDNIENAVRHDALEKALVRLKMASPDSAYIVELRYYGNLSIEETAAVVGLSPSGVTRKWRSARAWLSAVLRPDAVDSEFEYPAPLLD